MRKNDKYIVDIIDMGMDGEGIAKVDGEVVFVPFAIKGEKVEILIINTKSKFAIAKVINILEPSPLRKTPLCPYFTKCGGCELQHIGYNDQLILKKNSLVTTLAKNGINHIVSDVVPCESEYRYRNKVALPVAMINGKTVIGMYRKGSHKIVEIDDCIIQMDFIKKLLEVSKSYIEANNISGYDEEKLSGDLRHIVARHYGDSILVTLVATKKNLPNIKDYYDRLKETYSNVGLSINVNTKKTNVIFGDTNIHIAGSEELHHH